MKFIRSYGNYHSKDKQRLLSWIKGLDPALKRMIIMRINFVIFFFTIAMVNVSAAVRAQDITLSVKDAPLTEVFKQIKKQSGLQFLYNNADLSKTKSVTLQVKNANLKETLDKVFEGQPLTYAIIDNSIVVTIREVSLLKKVTAFFKAIKITGTVTDENGSPLPGVNVKLKGTDKQTRTNKNGMFAIEIEDNRPAVLVFSYIGFEMLEKEVSGSTMSLNVRLKESLSTLNELTVVSTGYQQLPKERASGSFEIVDNKLLNRRISTNVTDRIENVVPGVLFDRSYNPPDPLSIRGRSTLLAVSAPLIVLDNFPFDGNVNDINPNDVESITILKDAAASSIWGARAGNGVIIISTKKGLTSKPKVELTSNLTFVSKPSLSSLNNISSADYIELEKKLFTGGFYANDELSSSNTPLTPVVSLLIARRDGKIDPTLADNQIEAYKNYNSNSDIEKYLYRSVVNKQYQMNISGQSPGINYYFSAGLDDNPQTLVGASDKRISIRSNNTFEVSSKFSIEAGVNYAQSNYKAGNNPGYLLWSDGGKFLYPYARLKDEEGNNLKIVKDYNTTFITNAMQKGLLDWTYSPLDDIYAVQNKNATRNLLLKTVFRYKIIKGLTAEAIYQYQNVDNRRENDYGGNSYYSRNVVNKFTQTDPVTKALSYPIPKGDMRIINRNLSVGQQVRGQITYQQTFSSEHEISAIAGMEVRELKGTGEGDLYYGYNPNTNTSASSLDYTKQYAQYNNIYNSAYIPRNQYISEGTVDHFWSYFANASYTYANKYVVSGSTRTDASNLFGVKTNQKGVPLWSVGLAWQINNESFYDFDWLPRLKLRTTYGLQGNFSRQTSALTTANFRSTSTGYKYAEIQNPPNSTLRWEKVKMLNIGLDFATKSDLISGSIEYYNKKASDLMGRAPTDPTLGLVIGQSGNNYLYGNIANMAGHGFDIRLTSDILHRTIGWNTTALFSYVNMYVSNYFMPVSALGKSYVETGSTNPIPGKPIFGMNSYKWAGLDHQTGDPQGILNGQISKDYSAIALTTPLEEMAYSGNIVPKYFGSLRNDFSYKNVSLSFNVSFKAGYYFRRKSIDYSTLYSYWNQNGSGDYALRWIKPGDEFNTNVPSQIYPNDSNRDSFYTLSQVLVEKADHIRFEDITLGYDFNKRQFPKIAIQHARLFLYANNLGILWRANKYGIDPNSLETPTVNKTIAIGINVTF